MSKPWIRQGATPPRRRRERERTRLANHATITEASMHVAALELARHGPDAPLSRVLTAIMASPLGGSGWLLSYWSESALMSPEARAGWIAPDLAPLPELHATGL